MKRNPLHHSSSIARPSLRLAPLALAISACLLLGSCLEKVDAGIELNPTVATDSQEWRLAGEFGGEAELSVDDPDPFKKRFEPGGFKQLHGLRATAGEVWTTDLGLSRVQVFDSEGQFLRSYGTGAPLDETLPSLERLYSDRETRLNDPGAWDNQLGGPWRGSEGRLFQFADVLPLGDKLWAIDQAKTGVLDGAARKAGLRSFALPDPQLGSLEDLGAPSLDDRNNFAFPESLDADGETMAISEPWGNVLRLFQLKPEADMRAMQVGVNVNLSNVLRLRVALANSPQYNDFFRRDTNSNGQPGRFARLGGTAVAFRKVIACDGDTHRLQVFDGNTEDPFFWGKLLRVIDAYSPDGYLRFETPMDVAVGPQGDVYVLDIKRLEVAVLNSKFERIGSFGKGALIEPRSVEVSDDGLHCYVADRRFNKVLHFVREK